MRLFEVENLSTMISEYRDFINENCQPYLSMIEDPIKYKMLRGTNGKKSGDIIHTRPDRKPLHSSKFIHDIFEISFKQTGITANRSNSIFTTGYYNSALAFGSVYVVYPIGDFDFSWSPKVEDLQADANFWKHLKLDTDQITLEDLNPISQLYSSWSKFNPFFMPENLTEYLRQTSNSLTTSMFETLVDHMPEEKLYRILDYSAITGWIKDRYQTTDLQAAISSGYEIMVKCEKYLILDRETNFQVWQ